MTRAYNVVDADGHILEPLDLWDRYIDPEFRERRPRFVIDDNGKERLSVEGKLLGNPRGIGSLGAVGVRQGDVIRIPPGVKHWHGAAPTTSMAHIAIVEQLDGKSTDWMEKVSEEQYNMPVRGREPSTVPNASAQGAQPTPAQRLIGDFSPKLVELTDEVLFGDVWARPQLSPRDRSLVTVSALIAMNRPDQLRSHLTRARNNGVTQEELVETITHLAFYAGWPSAMTAITVAKEVFEDK